MELNITLRLYNVCTMSIPRFSIEIRVRRILMRTPFSTHQYPLNVSSDFYLHFKGAKSVSLYTYNRSQILQYV